METQVTPNTFCTYTGPPAETEVTVFFISGNPGLISYYHPFLSLLAQNLASTHEQDQSPGNPFPCQIYGCSLGGFEIETDDASTRPSPQPKKHDGDQHHSQDQSRTLDYYDLEDQIHFIHRKLTALMRANAASNPELASRRQKVVLIGHSVGAYMAMEILRRHREATFNPQPTAGSQPSELKQKQAEFDIVGGVMLFPTVVDIAASPSGRKLTTLLSFIPQLALVVGLLAKLLTLLLPARVLRGLIVTVMRDPPVHALDTTFAFLKSSKGVTQALHMAADEMRAITSDRWTDDVWGVGQEESVAQMYFYFGRNDHWVAETTRNEIIALRGEQGSGPTMFVCEEGLPHAFCLKHNDTMARKVARMIREIQSE
ncbi:hypothetical protein N7492_000196 [Penicillium capsulatum]|uniref:Uncharacterized protein n=1 Tax=Penicillium capsulatum TaxID=69766 RepID=A0A9W9IT23_9EURO|nr:hypothetical protein N7492_000196 [Penicillium capsulatum]KAJ6130739.1 hypothetical protein N7512_003519 [Penicillium capsulatum]